MSTNPGVTNRPLTLIVRRASAAGSEGATALILPPAMPMSIKPRSPPAGSSTSPPASKRSYFIAPSMPLGCSWSAIGVPLAISTPPLLQDKGARLMPKFAPSSGRLLRLFPRDAWRARNDGRFRHRKRLVERDFSKRARVVFGACDWRHRDERNADVGHRDHHADHCSRYRRGELLHLGSDALHDRLDRRRCFDRHGVVAPWCAARLYARRRGFRGWHVV